MTKKEMLTPYAKDLMEMYDDDFLLSITVEDIVAWEDWITWDEAKLVVGIIHEKLEED